MEQRTKAAYLYIVLPGIVYATAMLTVFVQYRDVIDTTSFRVGNLAVGIVLSWLIHSNKEALSGES